MKNSLVLLVLMLLYFSVSAQIGINTPNPDASAAIDVSSTSKGMLVPRMTCAQRIAIANPATGLLVFDISKHTFYMFNGIKWLPLTASTTDYPTPVGVSANDGFGNDNFGKSVAIEGNYAVVGAPTTNVGYFQYAYVFQNINNQWLQIQKLQPLDIQVGDLFGSSVSIQGDYIVIGAPGKKINNVYGCGAAYVFLRNGNTWTQQQKLTINGSFVLDYFGSAVDIDGTNIIVGAPYADISGVSDRGAAYLYTRSGTTWTMQHQFLGTATTSYAYFGTSVAVDGSTIAAGAPGVSKSPQLPNTGKAFAYKFALFTWVETQFEPTSYTLPGVNFGQSIDIKDSILVVGAPYDDYTTNSNSGFPEQGAIYTYCFSSTSSVWIATQKIFAPDHALGDHFGYSVAFDGNYLVAGAADKSLNGFTGAGAIYICKFGAPSPFGPYLYFKHRYDLPDEQLLTHYGRSVGIFGTQVIAGSYNNDEGGKTTFLNLE